MDPQVARAAILTATLDRVGLRHLYERGFVLVTDRSNVDDQESSSGAEQDLFAGPARRHIGRLAEGVPIGRVKPVPVA